MALKEYNYNGSTYQFDDSDVPKGAVLVEAKAAKTPANKSRSASAKTAKTAGDKTPTVSESDQTDDPSGEEQTATSAAE